MEKIWTKEKIKDAALSCNTLKEFRNLFNHPYKLCLKNGWINEMTKHMVKNIVLNNYFTFEECEVIALKCNDRLEFRIKYNEIFYYSIRKKWINIITKHMKENHDDWTKIICHEKALQCETRNNLLNIIFP